MFIPTPKKPQLAAVGFKTPLQAGYGILVWEFI